MTFCTTILNKSTFTHNRKPIYCGLITIVYIVAGKIQPLLGLADAESLAIVQITTEGQLIVRHLTDATKLTSKKIFYIG